MTLLAIAAVRAESARGAEPPPSRLREPYAASPPTAGWRAFVDPRTGKLREPTPEEALELSRRSARKLRAPITFHVVEHPDGMKSVDLQDAFTMDVVARRNPDGSVSYECQPRGAAPTDRGGEK